MNVASSFDSPAPALLILGVILLLGLAADYLGRVTRLPRVTLLIGVGILFGPMGLALMPEITVTWFPLVTDSAMLLVGFLLGGRLSIGSFAEDGRAVLVVSACIVLASLVLMGIGFWIMTGSLTLALLFAATSTPTDPAATLDVTGEQAAAGPFTRLIAGIVAVDDVWALMVFSVMLALAEFAGAGFSGEVVVDALREVGGAMLLGSVLGLPMAWLSGRLRPGEPTLVEALGIVFLAGGLAEWLQVSPLLTAMTIGAMVVNVARHHEYAFHEIEGIEWPFMILFFVLTGSGFEVVDWQSVWPLAALYLVLRTLGRLAGGWSGAWLIGAASGTRRWAGPALMAQAGLANGMALVAVNRFPEFRDTLLPVVVIATIVFELAGPLATRIALVRVGEAGAGAR